MGLLSYFKAMIEAADAERAAADERWLIGFAKWGLPLEARAAARTHLSAREYIFIEECKPFTQADWDKLIAMAGRAHENIATLGMSMADAAAVIEAFHRSYQDYFREGWETDSYNPENAE